MGLYAAFLTLVFAVLLVKARRYTPHHRLALHDGDDVKGSSIVEWDHFMLVTEWPQSACEYVNATHQHHQCVIPGPVKGWTIHGLWPSTYSHKQPFYCESWKFDEKQVEDLLPQLNVYWPNIFAESGKEWFWSHEYEKHGTCAASVPGFHSEHDFFEKTLQLRAKYDIMSALSSNRIVPSSERTYEYADVQGALKAAFNADICVECDYIKDFGQVLSAAYVCMSKSLDLVDCQKCEHPCESSKPIYYHPIHTSIIP